MIPHHFKNWFRKFLLALLLLPTLIWAESPGIRTIAVETHTDEAVYLLDADIRFQFGNEIIEAIESGVPITFVLEIEVEQQRWWAWNKLVAALSQRFVLQYHALSRQYLIINLNTGVQVSHYTRTGAELALGTIGRLPLIDRTLIEPGTSYRARLRTRLDIEALPSPLRPWAYFSTGWRLTSEWFEWSLPS